jgi:predicted MFS family arabinose efflux permease
VRDFGFKTDQTMHRLAESLDARRAFVRDATAILILALVPAAGLGIARFAYALLLPDMRASLGSYATAGFMNTVNAAGYLAGALIAAQTIRRLGAFKAVVAGSVACVAALAASALTAHLLVLSLARLLAGIGGAVAFIAGAVIAAQISQRHRSRASFYCRSITSGRVLAS